MLHFIVNGQGGSGKAARTWAKVQKILEQNGVEYLTHETMGAGHATEIVRGLTGGDSGERADQDVSVVVVGGDGTVNEVLNGVQDFYHFRLGLIPTGSGNDFARGMGIPKNTKKAVRILLGSTSGRLIDIGRVSTELNPRGRYFGISAGIGMDAIVCKKAETSRLKKSLNKLGMGQLTYILLTIHTLFSMATETVSLMFDGSSNMEHYTKLIFLAGMNFRAEGGGVPMAPEASAEDGKLSMCMASGIPRWKAFMDFPVLVAGGHGKLKGFTLRNFTKLEVNCEKPMVLHYDGEYGGDVCHAKFECIPHALRMMV